jgi:quercetin dioxygenase-like cupin family protein
MKHFIDLTALNVKDRLPGATAAYFQTEFSTVAYTELKAGAVIPLHNHIQEAVDIILEGELCMHIDGDVQFLKPGMMSVVPSYSMHKAKAITDCKVITILHPQRDLS